MKSEPEVFSIDDLAAAKRGTTFWDGVRNYQARNLLRDEIQVEDLVLYYHSNAAPSAIVGTAVVVKPGSPDPTQFDPKSDHHDPASTPQDPRWFGVHIQFASKFSRPVTLDEVKADPLLSEMVLAKRSRLSVQPVTKAEFDAIVKLGSGR